MRRISLITSLVSLALLVALLGGSWSSQTIAQDATPMAVNDHPLVGAWLIDVDTANPENPMSLATFSSDGIYTQHDPDGTDGVGAWEATGESTAALTFIEQFTVDDAGTVVRTTIRVEIEVSEDGQSVTGTYSVEFAGEGFPEGEFGPATAEGERIVVEEIGTDLTPLDEAFGDGDGGEGAGEEAQGEGGEATPAA